MGGTSERRPAGRDRARRHLHAVPPAGQDPEQDADRDAGAGDDGSSAGQDSAPASPDAAPASPDAAPASQDAAPASQDAAPAGPAPGSTGGSQAPSGRAATSAAAAGGPSTLLGAASRHLAAAGPYLLLFVFGVLQGLTGAFQFSRSLGPVPVAAVCFVLAIGATCWLGGLAARSFAGALVPAVGWIVASFAMAMPNTSGSIVITNSIAGEVYLYGGALCAAIGVGAAFGGWTRAQQADSSGWSRQPRGPRP